MESLPPAAQDKLKKLRMSLDNIPAMQQAEEVTKVPKEMLVVGGGVFLCTCIFFSIGAGSVCSLIGFAYPAYKSFEAIEGPNKKEVTQWLIYWVVYAFFSIIEVFVDFLLYWIPFYYTFKMAFLVWAMLPQTKGAKYLYDSFLKDFLKKNESKIDKALSDAKKKASLIASEAGAATVDLSCAAAKAAAANLSSSSIDSSAGVANDVANDTTVSKDEKKDE